MKKWNDFKQIWILDFEFFGESGDPQTPICCTAKDILTGEIKQEWIGKNFKQLPYPISSDNLYVAYYSSAEWGCHLSLGLPLPLFILDLYAEFRNLTNGLYLPHGAGLLGACEYYGINGSNSEYKDSMRNEILEGKGNYTETQEKNILDYNNKDVLLTEQLFYKMKNHIDLTYALLRGRYMGCVARMEYNGIPIDVDSFLELKQCFPIIQEELIWRINKDFDVFEGKTFKEEKFKNYLHKNNIPWDFTPEGHLRLEDDYFKDMSVAYPQLAPLKDLRYALSQLKLNNLQVGGDGRNRCLLSPFRAKTGRNQPSSAKYIFGPATWIRFLIKPTEGNALAYIDYSQQEIAIAAQLSQDKNLLQTYSTGDPYLAFAKRIGAIPPEGNKQTHGVVRDLFKRLFLATNYGMSVETFAKQAGIPLAKAKALLAAHKRTFEEYWIWAKNQASWAVLNGKNITACHWNYITKDAKERSLFNWPMQATGADILRIAVCLCTQNGIKICGPVHDAILIEAPINEIESQVTLARKLMEHASEMVLGLKIRTDAKIIRYPDRYTDPRGDFMWNTVWDILKNISPEEKRQRIFELQNQTNLLEFTEETEVKPKDDLSKKRRRQLMLKPINSSEKSMVERIKKQGCFSHVQIMALVRAVRDSDFDLEHEVDWKNDSYQVILNRIKNKTTVKQITGEIL